MSPRKAPAAPKPPAKAVAKGTAKAVAKGTAKPAAKGTAKPAAKGTAKPAAKGTAKPAAKGTAKAGPKTAKPAARTAPAPAVLPSVAQSATAFRHIATDGQGHPGAARVQAMAWFQDRLFAGTACFEPRTQDDRARILAHDPAGGDWQVRFESPLADLGGRQQAQLARLDPDRASGGRRLTRATGAVRLGHDFAITAMAVFQGRSDAGPCLYCGTASLGGGLVLRSEDGSGFVPVSLPGIDDDSQMSVGALAVAGSRLFAAPMGTLTTQEATRDVAPANRLYYSDDPASGDWHRLAPPGFDATGNTGVTALAVAQDHLYAAISNPLSGYQIWRLPLALALADTVADAVWQQVLQNGAWRFNHNLAATALAAFGDALYVGGGLPFMGRDAAHDVGPAACELVRLYPDGRWDLIMGEPRFTPDGLKVPLSAKGPGFGDPCTGAVQSLAVQGDTLFAGLSNWRSLDWSLGDGEGPLSGGFQLWASRDGEAWEQVLRDGHGQPGAVGLPALCATPAGLYLGSASEGAAIQAEAARHRGTGLALLDVRCGYDVLLAAPASP